MIWLIFIIHLFIGTTLAGIGVIAALVSGYDTLNGVLIAAAAGFILSLPVTWIVARQLWQRK